MDVARAPHVGEELRDLLASCVAHAAGSRLDHPLAARVLEESLERHPVALGGPALIDSASAGTLVERLGPPRRVDHDDVAPRVPENSRILERELRARLDDGNLDLLGDLVPAPATAISGRRRRGRLRLERRMRTRGAARD